MSRAWGLRVDPLVPEENRWHSSHHGTTVTTPDGIGDAFVATLRDAALEAGDGLDASVIAFCGRQVAQQLVDYEREPRLLAKLADTGRVVTVLLQASRTAAEVAPARDGDRDEEGREHVSKLTLWRRTLAEERVRRMEAIYEPLLSDDTRLMEEAGDETQQQEILTLMKNDVEIYGAVLTEREMDVIVVLYSRIVRRSGVVVGTIPRWFATTTSLWPDAAKTVMTDTGEDFACQISIWRTLRHPNVLRLYGACHVGQPYVIHEPYNPISTEVLWSDLLGLAVGLQYVHERGFVYRELTMGTFLRLSSERRLVVTGMGLMRTSRNERGGDHDRAANVMSFGLALLNILQRTRGDGGDQVDEQHFVNRQLPNSKPSYLTDAEWELVCSMCSVMLANCPSMEEVVWGVRNLVTLEARNPLEVEEVPTVAVGTYVWISEGLLISELLEAVCEEVADNGFLFRSVSDRLVNIYQQLEEHHESVPRVFVEDFCLVVCDFYRYLKKISDALSVDSLDSMDTLFSDNPFRFHHYLDRLMCKAPGLLHMSQLHRWNHLLQEEIRQAHEESMAAWKRTNVYELSGDVIDTGESFDEGQDALGAHFLESLREKERHTRNAVAINVLRRDVEKKLGNYNSEPRLLIRWAQTGYITRLIDHAMKSAVGILGLTSATMQWLEALQDERKQREIFYQELVADSARLALEMGDHSQTREIYTVLLYSRKKYASELSASEQDITLSLLNKLKEQLHADSISIPRWFALSENQWSFAQRSVLSGDEASCVQQIEICEQLNHPNVSKFYGAYHVGRAPFVILNETVAFTSKISSETKSVWRVLLDYAHGLQYILSRGLSYMALSLADLRVTWDGKRVLNSIGLAYQVTDDLDDSRRDQSATSNVSAFGLIAFQVIALKYLLAKTSRDEPSDDSSKLQYSKELGKEWLRGMQECDGLACAKIGGASDGIQADIVKVSETMTKDKWNLLCNLCKVTPGVRTDLTNFISEINEFTQAREAPGTPVENAPARLLGKMNEVVCSSSGRKLKDILAEIGDELNEISGPLQDDNRRVVDRLRDIYVQMENPAEPLLVTIVDDFVELVQGYCIQVSRRLENCDFSAHDVMMSSVALTVADRNESMHHLLDELIRNSGCLNGDNPVHEWQEHSRMQARQGYQKMMDTVPEDEDASFATSGDKHSDSPRWLLPTDEVRIRERIAHGSFGAAYWGKWLGADVVVKKVLTNQDEHRNRQQFRREVELWFSLNHGNVIKLYGACHEINKQPVFVCEQAIHGTLPSFLKGKSAEEIWGALYTAAEGLRHLHEQGIVHGDLKGNNVLACDNNYVKLADFGLSAFAKSVLTKVEKPESIGAIRWRAPECIQGFKPTFASDIYSFGMCIVEVVTGEFPWGKMPDPTVMYQVVNKKSLPPRLEAFNSDERRLVKGMCRYDPKDRIDIGAVVCLLYQLYSGMGSLGVSAEQDADYTDEAILERFMAMRRRETLPNSVEEVSEWFIHAYHVEQASHIRNGGFGSVRWAGADVALQRIHFDKKNIVTILEEFRRQLQLWSVLDHPNIIQLYGAYHVENPFYVCERTVNGTLTEYLKWKDQALPWRCLLDAALGLQYLHTCGVVHGDLNGNGLLVSDSGKTKVGSFELTAFVGSDDIYEEDDTAIRWRAPEVLDGGNPTFAADIYSFGMCMIEACTGEFPWDAENDIAITFQVKRGELPPRPAQMNDWEWELVKRMCRFDPNSRISIDAVVCYISGLNAETSS